MQATNSYRKEPAQRLNISSAPRKARGPTSGSTRAPFAWDSPQARPSKRALAREEDTVATEEMAPAPPMMVEPAVQSVIKSSPHGGNEPDKENIVAQVTEPPPPPSAAEMQETPALDARSAALVLLQELLRPLERALAGGSDGAAALSIAMRTLGLPEGLAPHLCTAMEGASSLHEAVADLLAPGAPAAKTESIATTAPPETAPEPQRPAVADEAELEELHARDEARRQREAALEAEAAAATARAVRAEAETARLTEEASALKAQLECLDCVDVMRGVEEEQQRPQRGEEQEEKPPAAMQQAEDGQQQQAAAQEEQDLIAWREAAEKARQMVRQTRGRGGAQQSQQSQPPPAAPCLMDEDVTPLDCAGVTTMLTPSVDGLQEEPPAKRARTAVAWVVEGTEEAEEEAEGGQEQEQEQDMAVAEPPPPVRKAMVWVADGTEEPVDDDGDDEEKEPEAHSMDVAEPPPPVRKGLVWVADGSEDVEEEEAEAEEAKPAAPTVVVEEDPQPKGMAWVI